jgi:hypothetical protein
MEEINALCCSAFCFKVGERRVLAVEIQKLEAAKKVLSRNTKERGRDESVSV